MLNRTVLCTALLLLPAMGAARAQRATAPRDTATQMSQRVEIGYRATSVDGDEARWERYRDLRDGPVLMLGASRSTAGSMLEFQARNIGYHDQQFELDYNDYGTWKVKASFNSIPLNYAYNTLTPWQHQGGNVWSLDQAARTQVETKVPGVLGIGTTAAHFDQASIYRGLADPFAMQARRDVASARVNRRLSEVTSLDLSFSTTKKSGNQPYGASYAFSNGNELPMAIDNRTNDVTAAFEWAEPSTGMFRLGWTGSWFDNQFQSLTWDNPLRATDFSNGKLPPSGPFDPSGYSNGNGPAKGRLALPPSNSLNSISAVGLYKMPGRTTLNGHLSLTSMRQDEALIPWTTNSVINSATVWAAFPHLQQLPRQSAEAEVRGVNAMLGFVTRPSSSFSFDMRYRFNDHENRTPHFDAVEYVRFDAVPEETGGESEQFNIRVNTIETGASFTPRGNTSFRLGYILDDYKREGRSFSDMTDYTFRLSVDTYGSDFLTVRGIYEDSRRVGNGFSEMALEEGGAQPGLRFYDEADRTRNRGTVIMQLMPSEKWDVGLTLATTKDEYKGEGFEFGLLDSKNTSYNLSVDFYPMDKVTLGVTYGSDKFTALQKSRNANPPSGVPGAYESWEDPSRDWYLDTDETVTNAGFYLDVTEVLPKTNFKLSYDFSDSDQGLNLFGPRVQALITGQAGNSRDTSRPCPTGFNSCFTPMPNVTNDWTQIRMEVQRMFQPKLGLNLAYQYEKFNIVDYATTNLPDGTPRIDNLGSLTTGYGNRPYKGSAVMLRLIYMF